MGKGKKMGVLIDVIVPVFALIALGFSAGKFLILGQDSAVSLNKFVYFFALPSVLFLFTAQQPLAEVLNLWFIISLVVVAVIMLIIMWVVELIYFRADRKSSPLRILNGVYPNTSYMGVPIFLTAFGPNETMPAIIATVFGIGVMVSATIAFLEVFRTTGTTSPQIGVKVATTLVKNPLLLSAFLGIVFSALEWNLPAAASNFLELLASCAGPTALFALGLSLVGRKLTGNSFELSWVICMKLIGQPIITAIVVLYLIPMEHNWAMAAIILAGLPTGAVSYIVAQQYGRNVEPTSATILLSTVLSLPTMSVILYFTTL